MKCLWKQNIILSVFHEAYEAEVMDGQDPVPIFSELSRTEIITRDVY